MSIVALLSVWLSVVLPLTVAAIGRHHRGTKIVALLALAVFLIGNWLFIMVAFAINDDRSLTPLQIATPLLILYVAVAVASFRRKLA